MSKQWANPSRGAPTHIRNRVLARDGHACQRCGDDGAEVDHIVPKFLGGTDDMDNLQTLCASCHWSKTKQESKIGQKRTSHTGMFPSEKHPGLL